MGPCVETLLRGCGTFENWFFQRTRLLFAPSFVKAPLQNQTRTLPLLIGLQAARANFVPGLIVQTVMILVVLAYYSYEPARVWLAHLAEIKARWGYGFSFLAGAVAGGLLPELLTITVSQRGRVRWQNAGNLLFGILFWGSQGVVVDGLYRFQAVLFGSHADFATVVKKVLVDQFVYNPLYAAPVGLAIYEWKNQGYRLAGMGRVFTARFYKERTLPALVATWGVWIPVVSMVYSLPSLLQIPLFSLALTFWVILFTWINRQH